MNEECEVFILLNCVSPSIIRPHCHPVMPPHRTPSPSRLINLRPGKTAMGQQGGATSVPCPSLGLAGAPQPVSGLAVANTFITRRTSLTCCLSLSYTNTHLA